MKNLCLGVAALALGLLAAGCESAPICESDAGALPTRLFLGPGMDCTVTRLSIPRRHQLSCGALPGDFEGSRVVLEGRVGQNWRLIVDRLDGTPEAVCAAVLDDMCRCARGECTANAAERQLVMDLGTADRTPIEVVLGAGTYEVELCSR